VASSSQILSRAWIIDRVASDWGVSILIKIGLFLFAYPTMMNIKLKKFEKAAKCPLGL